MDRFDALLKEASTHIAAASSMPALNELRVTYLGKNSAIIQALAGLRNLEGEAKKEAGARVNEVRTQLDHQIRQKQEVLEAEALAAQLAREAIDVTLPARPIRQGAVHPLMQVAEEALAIFASMGFRLADGPDIEDEYHNFTALNIPETHPARQLHDTFYLQGLQYLLRTHTSPVQIRAMKAGEPPFSLVSFGRTYRSDWDATHTPMFHQIEGLVVGKDIAMAHLKGCLQEFVSRFFGVSNVPIRLRPHYFPFTEPSAELDVQCQRDGKHLKVGEGDSWMELLGCGMVHPAVLHHAGVPEGYQGFAFGMGVERLAMVKYGIGDLRAFFENDVRWLEGYGAPAQRAPAIPERR